MLSVGDASLSIATDTMNNLRIDHVYGSTVIQSYYCSFCKQRAFVMGTKTGCCGRPLPKEWSDKVKVEVDTIGHKRKQPPKWMKEAILDEQHGKCIYCGRELDTMELQPNGKIVFVKTHWDHVIPFAYNGNNHEFVAACARCNIRKGARMFNSLHEVRMYFKERYGHY